MFQSFDHQAEAKSARRSSKSGVEPKQSYNGGRGINIILMGRKGVGKTALTVRYLTKRFIGDYESGVDVLYTHNAVIDGKHLTLHILDTAGQINIGDVKPEQILWADGFLLVYSITDKTSFEFVSDICNRIVKMRPEGKPIIAIVANKGDLIYCKQVPDTDAAQMCAEYNCMYYETSASESYTEVAKSFVGLCKEIRTVYKRREKLTSFMSNPAIAAKLQIQQSFRNLAEKTWRSRTSTL
ncbi:hypothetical protein ACJMK2_030009 [Sinanodonta woodiana]|uniref:small monomeric GTPase n=1 Tax=Sinanodonta woodiana TaxID=1069815 RepID=A0ABD3XFL2_SINWO